MSTKPSAPAPAVTSSKKRGAVGLVLALIMAVMAVAFLPTTLVVIVGMLPSAVAYFVDSSRDRTLGPTVLFLNFGGVLPSLLKLWHQGHNVANALEILMQPQNLLIMLLPSAFGWLLFAYVPILVSSVIRRNAESRIRTLEKEQEYLIEQWGNILAHPNGLPPVKEQASDKSDDDMESTLA